MGHGYPDYGGWGLIGALLPLLTWGGLIGTAALAARFWGGRGGGDRLPPPQLPRPEDRALAILRERYARGEIASAEYEERRRWLLDDPPNL